MSEKPLRERVMEVLGLVQDPELHQDLVTLGMIGQLDVSDEHIRVQVMLTTPACPLREDIGASVRQAIATVAPDAEIEVVFGSKVRRGTSQAPDGEERPLLPGVRNVILVASGKGGVGKSTVAANLAVSLALEGAAVGLMDADIHGPSLPIMMGAQGSLVKPRGGGDKTFDPVEVHGIKLMSMGFFLPATEAVIWRGPMMSSAITQFARDCEWGELDYLVLDLPPGTGDVQLTVSQKLKVTGAVVVSTPQDVALADVVRAQAMFARVDIPVLGVIENMSFFICDGCGKRHELFGTGGARDKAGELGLHYLGALPLDPAVRESGDRGAPQVLADPESETAQILREMAREVAGRASIVAHMRATQGGVQAH